jgi:serine/threonine-protein phosphatase 2A regulatory subunit A
MASSLTPEIIKQDVLSTVANLADDPIPNVRFNVAKSLEVLAPILKKDQTTDSLVAEKVIPVLEKLSQDSDVDVKWFAEKALLSGKERNSFFKIK